MDRELLAAVKELIAKLGELVDNAEKSLPGCNCDHYRFLVPLNYTYRTWMCPVHGYMEGEG